MSQNPPTPDPKIPFNIPLAKILQMPEELRARAFKRIEEVDPEVAKQIAHYLNANKGVVLESHGYEKWLSAIGPHSFTGDFSDFHKDIWNWYWPVTQRQRSGLPMDLEDRAYFAIWGRGLGKCLSKGTEILYADGQRRPIEDVRKGDILMSVDCVSGRSVKDRVVDTVFSGKQHCLRLRTRTNKSILATEAHRFWTLNGWKSVSDLRVGDRIAVPRKTRTMVTETRTDAEVRLTAYMIAEGCTVAAIQPSGTVSIACQAGFTNADKVIVQDFYECAKSMGFGVGERGHISYRLIGAQQWLRDIGLSGKGAHQKRVPSWVFSLSERQRWMFLAALIDTDGYVVPSAAEIGIALSSKELIRDISYLFTSVGVVTTTRYKTNKCKGAWVLTVDKNAIGQCAINLPLQLKAAKLSQCSLRPRYSLLDTYPASVGRNLPRRTHRKIRNGGGPKFGNANYAITREKIRAGLSYVLLPQWAWLEQADVLWDEIVELVDDGEHDTYDLTMHSASHNFIANEIVSHNSTNAEWLAIAEGCLIGKGFVLYVSGTAEQAEAHVEAIRERIESEGQLGNLYPSMRKPEVSEHKGGKGKQAGYGWRQDYLMTANGWAVRPVGLDKAIRGWKRGDNRVSLIILDDIDDDDDSPEVILKKERRIAKKILPMGTARTKMVFAQNLIHSNSVLNRMHTRQTDMITLRRGDVPIPAFAEIEIEHQVTERGPRSKIVGGKPTWPFIDMAECQAFLDDSGRDAFMAEYQHDFTGEHQDRVLPEYDDRVLRTHLITWEQFFAKYGAERIPREWPCDVGLDLGYTTGHLSAWTFLTKVPEGYPLAGSIFRYRGCTFENISLTAQEALVKQRMWPGEELQREFMSHEKLGEQLTLNREHGWHFRPCESGKTAGLAQWRHYLIPDRKQPHPFHRDEKGEDGLWKIGCPSWFDITVSSQFHVPNMTDDLGLKIHRDQTYKWKMRPVEETKSGMTVEQPIKAREDTADSTRMLTVNFGPLLKTMTPDQKLRAMIPTEYQPAQMLQRGAHPNQIAVTNALAMVLAKQAAGGGNKPMILDEYGNQRS